MRPDIHAKCTQFVVALALSVAIGCNSSSGTSGGGSGGKSAADLKAELLATAKQMEGGSAAAVEEWVKSAETGSPWSIVDDNILKERFTLETKAAYKKWRDAKIAEDKSKKK